MTTKIDAAWFADDLETLNATLLKAAARDIAPQAPSPGEAAQMRARVLRRLLNGKHGEQTAVAGRRNAPGFADIAADEGWHQIDCMPDGVLMKLLFDDGVTATWLARVPPGCEVPGHEHDVGPDECLVLSGDLWLNGVRMTNGDYQFAAQGTAHESIRSEQGCVVFVRSPSSRTPRPAGGAFRSASTPGF